MTKDKVLIVGLGEIGHALFELLKKENVFTVYGLDLDEAKMSLIGQKRSKLPNEVDTMHICLPYKIQENFVDAVTKYAKQFKPRLLIINSTIPPGTTKKISESCKCLVAHSPVRGVHKNPKYMEWELKRWTKYVGGINVKATDAACMHFEKTRLKVKALKSCTETELAKLFETTYRAWMIACFQEMHRISRSFRADFDSVVDFIEDTHRRRFDRPVMFPGFISGHCVIPNVELLLESYDSDFLRLVLESNQKRKKEINDRTVWKELEKVRRRAEAVQKDLTESLGNRCPESDRP